MITNNNQHDTLLNQKTSVAVVYKYISTISGKKRDNTLHRIFNSFQKLYHFPCKTSKESQKIFELDLKFFNISPSKIKKGTKVFFFRMI